MGTDSSITLTQQPKDNQTKMTSSTVSLINPADLEGRRTSQPPDTAAKGSSGKPTARVQFDVSSRSMERLTALKDKIEANSYAEVVKNALRLYEALIEEVEKGSQFLVRDSEGNLSPFRMFV
jgi:hypothetical protein